jgi:serine O-acetyltransferase
MENKTFDELIQLNCFSDNPEIKRQAAELLEYRYCCEIRCDNLDKSVRFAHHARGCTIVAAKICAHVVIFQNVTIGSNQRYNRKTDQWENIGTPILADNVIVADGAKILGPITIGENTVIGAGAIITKDIPANSVAFGVNQYKPKHPDYDLIINESNVAVEEIIKSNENRIAEFDRLRKAK